MINIVLFGPPGAGKGTQAKMLSEKYGFNHISTGEVIRNEIQRGTELGLQVKEVIESVGRTRDRYYRRVPCVARRQQGQYFRWFSAYHASGGNV